MSEKYILRHKLKNPTYKTDSEHQWFNIIDILQKTDENSNTENEIQIHGNLKDKNSVSTENIKDKAIIESKIDDKAVSKAKTNFLIYGNVTKAVYENEHGAKDNKYYAEDNKVIKIEEGTLSINDFSTYDRDLLKQVANYSITDMKLASNAVTTDKINSGAVTTDKINSGAVTWPKLSTDINWSKQLPENTKAQNGLVLAGDNNASTVWATDDDGNPGWRKVSNQFDTKLFGTFIGEYKPISNVFPKEGYFGNEINYKVFQGSPHEVNERYVMYADATSSVALRIHSTTLSFDYVILPQEQNKFIWGLYTPINQIASNPADYEFFRLDPFSITHTISMSIYIHSTDEEQTFKTDFQFKVPTSEESKVYDKCYSVPTVDVLEEYFSRINRSYSTASSDFEREIIYTYLKNLKFTSFEEAKAAITEDYLQNICQDYYDEHFKKPEDTWTQLIEKKYDTTEIANPLSDWDYNHCGIWIET